MDSGAEEGERAAEKERRKEKKRQLAAKRAAGEVEEEEDAERRKKRARTEGPRKPFQARIVVDLGFDDMMTENEVKSLTSQLAYTYSANRKASQPFSSVLFTSLNGKTYTRLEGQCQAAYKRWHDTEWWTEGYERLWVPEEPSKDARDPAAPSDSADVTNANTETSLAEETPAETKTEEGEGEARKPKLSLKPQRAPQESVVYLTADSPDELTELKEGETYVIGGICDHNRYKNLCYNKANNSKIRSAKLPIGTYLAELRTRKVLTVNQTFEILLSWVETKDWRQAFETVVPKRKFKDPGNGDTSAAVADGAVDAEEDVAIVVDAAALDGDGDIEEDVVGADETADEQTGAGASESSNVAKDSEPSDVPLEITISADVSNVP